MGWRRGLQCVLGSAQIRSVEVPPAPGSGVPYPNAGVTPRGPGYLDKGPSNGALGPRLLVAKTRYFAKKSRYIVFMSALGRRLFSPADSQNVA